MSYRISTSAIHTYSEICNLMTMSNVPNHDEKYRQFWLGDWHVQPDQGQLSRGGQSLQIEPKAMEVLVYLVKHQGEVVSRNELEQCVWHGALIGYDAITSTVIKLRKALCDSARDPCYIKTVPKRGYLLLSPVRLAVENGASDITGTITRLFSKKLWRVVTAILLLVMSSLLILIGLRDTSGLSVVINPAPNSIAVLPFENLSGDPKQDYFVDGMTDDLITELAKDPQLFVISRYSTFLYKHDSADFREVAKRLNARYLLRGSVWRDGTSVRVDAQLIDGVSGSHLWADRYQGVLDKVFKLQDTIINNVLLSLRLELHKDAQSNHLHKETTNPAAYDYFLHGRHHFNRYASKEENAKARDLYWKAIELDREFAMAYAMLAWTYAFDAMNGWSEMRKASLDRAFELAMTAITLDEELPVAYFVIGLVYRERGEYLNASGEAKKAIRLEPSYANAYVLLGTLQYRTGALEEGLTQIKMAMRLNPHHPYNYPFHLGQAYYMLGQFPDAIQAFEQGLASNPSSERLHVWLAAAYLRAGRADDARWEAEQVLTLNPTFLLDRIEGTLPFDNLMDHERFLNNLRTAGLP